MRRSLFAVHLFAGKHGGAAAAIRASPATDPQIKNPLDELRGKPDLRSDLKKAVDDALRSIDNRLRLTGLAANLSRGSASAACAARRDRACHHIR